MSETKAGLSYFRIVAYPSPKGPPHYIAVQSLDMFRGWILVPTWSGLADSEETAIEAAKHSCDLGSRLPWLWVSST